MDKPVIHVDGAALLLIQTILCDAVSELAHLYERADRDADAALERIEAQALVRLDVLVDPDARDREAQEKVHHLAVHRLAQTFDVIRHNKALLAER